MIQEALQRVAQGDTPRPFSSLDIDVLYTAAFSLYEAGDFERAEPIFRQLVLSKPFESKHWKGLAACLQMAKKFQDALTGWSMVALIDTVDPMAHFHAAECLIALNQNEEAFKALKEAQERTLPDDPLRGKIEILWQTLPYPQ